ncbi:hypothetical protein [Streptosporangium saharense]|uniref:hypothetical protein n=1 Tax=Streptosporangium saharense TaxID=1706840 RepID=UPI00332ADA5D
MAVTYRLTGAVMAHPRRRRQAEALSRRLPVEFQNVVTDPDPSGPPGGYRTSRLAWSLVPAGATHHLLLHDDMEISKTLLERAERAVSALPHAALGLFAFWSSRNGAAVRQGALAGARWVSAVNEWSPTNAIILPREAALGYVDYLEGRDLSWPDDVLMHHYLRLVGVPTYLAVPALAEHDDLPSLVDNDYQGLRRAACFFEADPAQGTPETSLDLDAVPFFVSFAENDGAARTAVRLPGDGPARWNHVGCEEYLDRFGITPAVPSLPSEPGPEPGLAAPVWLTAFTMGVVHRTTGRDLADDDVTAGALATLVPGGLCHRLGASRAAAVSEALMPVLRHGLAAGLETAPRRRRSWSLRVRLVGGEPWVREYVADRLDNLGFAIVGDGADRDVHLDGIGPTDATVLRLGDVYGPGMPDDGLLGRMVRLASLSRTVEVDDSDRPVALVHVKDVADAAALAVRLAPGTFSVAGPVIGVGDLAETVFRVVRPVELVGTPGAAAPAESGEPVPGWAPSVPLDHGIHGYSQWLAHEVDFSLRDSLA